MGLIDILVLATFFISILCALYRGLVKELLSISSWIIAALAALYGFTYLRPLFSSFIENEAAVDLAAAASIALVVLIILTLINARITKSLRKSALSGLDRSLGFLFGIFRAVLLICVVFLVAKIPFSDKQIQAAAEKNFSIPYIEKSAAVLEKIIPDSLLEDLNQKPQEVIEKASQKSKELKENITEYTKPERESLNELIEENIDIEELL